MEYVDYYKVLGVSREDSTEKIKKAWRKLAQKYHPDRSREPGAEERFKEIQEAWDVLGDPQKRASYDQLGNQWKNGQEFHPPPGWEGFSGFEGFQQGAAGSGHGVDVSEFFASLFGGRGGMGGSQGRQAARGRDEQAQITLSLEEAFRGGSRTIQLQTQGRSGPPQVRTLKITLPPGMLPGQQLRLAGQGSPGRQGTAGDLYLHIQLLPHALFTLEGRDIQLVLPVTPWECALGAKVTLPTLAGSVDVKIAAGSQSGQKLRLKGRGFPGNPPGDQFAILKMVTPPANTEAARAFYENMAKELPFRVRDF